VTDREGHMVFPPAEGCPYLLHSKTTLGDWKTWGGTRGYVVPSKIYWPKIRMLLLHTTTPTSWCRSY